MLWFLWAPLIVIGLFLLIVLVVFLAGIYRTEYGNDDGHEVREDDYSGLETFPVDCSYVLLVRDSSLLPVAGKFNSFASKIMGRELTLANEDNGSPYIELKTDSSVRNGYSVSSDNRNITISADNRDHLLRGSLAFLEEFGGLKCYTSKIIIPTADKISFPRTEGGFSKTYTDFFEMRDTEWISPKDDDYSWFRGFNTDVRRFYAEGKKENETEREAKSRIEKENAYYASLGGRTQYISGFCHTFTGEFLSASKYYDKGECLECYALDRRGKRRRDELCLTNPKTLEIVTREVFDILENKRENGKRYDPAAPLQIISLTQSDDITGCKCPECLKCAREHGGYSAPNLLFVNEVARAVKEAGYENVAIDTFAYRYTRRAPKDIVPLDNVIIRLCSIECCVSHYIDDRKCAPNRAFMKDLDDWSKICKRIYIWDYCTDFSYYIALFPNFNTLSHNIRVFYEHNVKGVYEEGNYTLDKNRGDTGFGELRAYLMSRVMQNPYCDYEKVMREFCDAFYGEAGGDMFAFISKCDAYAGRRHLNIYKKPSRILACSKSEMKELEGLFEHAKSVAEGEYLKRVRESEICWRYIKMYKRAFEFSKRKTYETRREQLTVDIAKTNTACMHEVDAVYKKCHYQQTGLVSLYPLVGFIMNKFIYGP